MNTETVNRQRPDTPNHILGGSGDGRLRVSLGAYLGQRREMDPTPVRRVFFDISHPKIRYSLAQKVRYWDTATGDYKLLPEIETITYRNDRGVIVIDPLSERTSDILQPDEFTRRTANNGGILPLDMANVRHTFRENNPLITSMVKEAFHYIDELIFHGLCVAALASYDGDLSSREAGIISRKQNALLYKSSWDYDPKAKHPKEVWDWSQEQKYPRLEFIH